MGFLRKAVAVCALTFLVGPAAMACTIPEAQLTPAEHQCCQRMARQCGSMSGSMSGPMSGSMSGSESHSCCQTQVRPDTPYVTVHRIVALDSAALGQPAGSSVALPLSDSPALDRGLLAIAHSPPPGLDPTTVLRI